MSENTLHTQQNKNSQNGGELLKSFEDKISDETVKTKFQIERVFILGKFFPFLLETSDFGVLIDELQYDRNPGEYENHEDEPLIDRVGNTNKAPEKLKVA
ncbi:hypothetical protein GW846_04110 [Candidatus Gracilibacteria bacterium]|nr:hypothetical protein [Candidatus Gracilibacteria bacterium]